MAVFIRSCIDKMESMDPQLIASTFLAFLQRWAVNHVQWQPLSHSLVPWEQG